MTWYIIEADKPEDIGKDEKQRFIIYEEIGVENHNLRGYEMYSLDESYAYTPSISLNKVHPATPELVSKEWHSDPNKLDKPDVLWYIQ